MPQPPQFLASVRESDSQPSSCLLPLQSAKLAPQAPLQTLCEQLGVTGLFEQAMPQAPQFFASKPASTSQPSLSLSPLQSRKPDLQLPSQPSLQARTAP